MRCKDVFITSLAILSCSFAASAPAVAGNDDIAGRCPAAQAWIDARKAQHPKDSDAAIAGRDAARHFSLPKVRARLLARADTDQKVRDAVLAAPKDQRAALMKRVGEVDGDNLAWLKQEVAAHGFPTVAQVGEQGLSAAFLLVQHADRDPAFQRASLAALSTPARRQGISGQQFAMLTDRVLVHDGKPQRYGTQMHPDPAHPGRIVMGALEDPAGLDARRAAVGMMPEADYQCIVRVVYHLPDPKPDGAQPRQG